VKTGFLIVNYYWGNGSMTLVNICSEMVGLRYRK